jgi:hypothetical protein
VACNIHLPCSSLEFYERFDEVMSGAWGRAQAHFHQRGYLLLLDDQNRDAWLRRYEVQRRMGGKSRCCRRSKSTNYSRTYMWAMWPTPCLVNAMATSIPVARYRALSNVRASCTAPGSRMKS